MCIFDYMAELENKFLHAINLDALKKETGMNIEELAALAGVGPKVVYKWAYMHKDSSRPDFNAVVRLLQKGATVETLFGVEYNPKKPDTTEREPIDFKDPKFLAMVKDALAEMKRDGQI